MDHHKEPQVTVLPPNKEKIAVLMGVFWFLLAVTALEFVIAFTMHRGNLKTAIFVGLTIVKAAGIVGEFMHLRYEAKVLMWSVLIPMLFVIWMLVAFVYEGMKIAPERW
jgi:cytochrome c oxidase subunit IV